MTQYIDKSALVAEIHKRLHANGAFDTTFDTAWAEDVGMCNAYKSILSFIDTLEVKEVDLEKELIEWHKEHFKKGGTFIGMSGFYLKNSSQMDIAKHFFELGLKAQKGE